MTNITRASTEARTAIAMIHFLLVVWVALLADPSVTEREGTGLTRMGDIAALLVSAVEDATKLLYIEKEDEDEGLSVSVNEVEGRGPSNVSLVLSLVDTDAVDEAERVAGGLPPEVGGDASPEVNVVGFTDSEDCAPEVCVTIVLGSDETESVAVVVGKLVFEVVVTESPDDAVFVPDGVVDWVPGGLGPAGAVSGDSGEVSAKNTAKNTNVNIYFNATLAK
ncbi:hypothetical protein EVJ58_g4507 [Rhodofomes roseus]|uniref:Uncharacterized protein n=1 Tax=Rhodofomes roseus TaxID=34475 RepID=A0A4Y9YFW9_9APHY|nr:hypothetical protein EVJ58_g4507 [Rhodofomes roseus]